MGLIGDKSFKVVIGVAGSFIILTDIFYYLFYKMTATDTPQTPKSTKKGKKKLKKPMEEKPLTTLQIEEISEMEPAPYKPYRNPWFRHLPRMDFLEGVSHQNLWNTALFFPEIFPEENFSQSHQYMWYMQQARVSLKVAIYTSNCRMFENLLFGLVRKKVKVMVVTNVPRLLRFRRRGVQVREKPKLVPSPHVGNLLLDHMHNKFVVIDDKAILTGSLNWTISAIQENRENILVTDDKNTVDLYVKEFDKIWELSDPTKPKIMAKAPPLTNKQRMTAQHTITKFRKS